MQIKNTTLILIVIACVFFYNFRNNQVSANAFFSSDSEGAGTATGTGTGPDTGNPTTSPEKITCEECPNKFNTDRLECILCCDEYCNSKETVQYYNKCAEACPSGPSPTPVPTATPVPTPFTCGGTVPSCSGTCPAGNICKPVTVTGSLQVCSCAPTNCCVCSAYLNAKCNTDDEALCNKLLPDCRWDTKTKKCFDGANKSWQKCCNDWLASNDQKYWCDLSASNTITSFPLLVFTFPFSKSSLLIAPNLLWKSLVTSLIRFLFPFLS